MSDPVFLNLPTNFSECERGNVWLVSDENHVAWLKLEGDYWLEVEVIPGNYPGMNVSVAKFTEKELLTYIRTNYDDWIVRKLNLEGSEEATRESFGGDERIVGFDEEEEDEEEACPHCDGTCPTAAKSGMGIICKDFVECGFNEVEAN